MEVGLVLAPETVAWRLPQVDGTDREIVVESCRICFTELTEAELPAHSERFGAFALEFQIDTLRRMGALPVIYMPQAVRADRGPSSVGSMIVAMMSHARYLLGQLENLRRNTDLEWVTANYGGVTGIQDDAVFNLNNTDDSGAIADAYQVPIRAVRDLLAFIGYKNAPFDLLFNTLGFVENLFYPTDDQVHDEVLAYYRQREWRLTPGLTVDGSTLGRELTEEEKIKVLATSSDFWSREIKRGEAMVRRVDAARVIDRIGGRPVHEQISSIIVPDEDLKRASEVVDGRVAIRVLDSAG